jgi:cytochrome b6-f complex iron-sulfur subunit
MSSERSGRTEINRARVLANSATHRRDSIWIELHAPAVAILWGGDNNTQAPAGEIFPSAEKCVFRPFLLLGIPLLVAGIQLRGGGIPARIPDETARRIRHAQGIALRKPFRPPHLREGEIDFDMAKKLSTQDILAKARAQSGQPAAPSPPGQDEPPAEAQAPEAAAESRAAEPPAAELSKPAAPKPAPKPAGGAPKSTKDILAAARAQSGGVGTGGAPAAPKPAAKAGSTKDILAAARAQAAGETGAGAAAEAAPKAAPKAKPAAKAAATGGGVSVQEMLKAVREGKKPEAPAAPQPVRPPIPQKPVARKAEPPNESRRNVILALIATPFALAWTLCSVASGAFLLGMARFMMPNVLVEPPSKFKVGPASDYPPGTVSTKWTAQFGIWLVHTTYAGRNMVYALASVCTHLGCTPNWLDGEQKFKCPCHGSGFYITGINFEGPAPRPLERVGIRVAEDGMLEVDKSVKFQQEMGQWEDPASYVETA